VVGGGGADYDTLVIRRASPIHPDGPCSFRLVAFGCKVNQYDSQVLRETLRRQGWREVDEGEAELVVIQTCTVTAQAGRKARRLARRLAREVPGARIAMTGCLADSEPEALKELPGVAWVLGNEDLRDPGRLVGELGGNAEPNAPPEITELTGHTRAFLKIQDGCDMGCAYCIVPRVRGASRSRPRAAIVAELRRLLASGHREVVLCGIHLGHWGRDTGHELGDLLEELAGVAAEDPDRRPVDWRLRLSSIEATEVEGPVLEALARHPERIAPHLHLPLQSGDDRVLRSMRRWYSAEGYLAICERIRTLLDRPALTTDVILGFPGEDEAAFENTLDVVRRAGFSRVHAFPFSPRPGTPAARPETLGRPVAPETLRERKARLDELARRLADEFRRGLVGRDERIVLEGDVGLAGRYQRVRLPHGERPASPGLLDVTIEGIDGEELLGRRIAPRSAGAPPPTEPTPATR